MPEAIDGRHAREVAELVHHPGWQFLMEQLAQFREDLLDRLAGCEDDAEILRLTRLWQWFRKILLVIKDSPEQLADDLRVYLETTAPMEALRDPLAPRPLTNLLERQQMERFLDKGEEQPL